jgi:hypothetical protein
MHASDTPIMLRYIHTISVVKNSKISISKFWGVGKNICHTYAKFCRVKVREFWSWQNWRQKLVLFYLKVAQDYIVCLLRPWLNTITPAHGHTASASCVNYYGASTEEASYLNWSPCDMTRYYICERNKTSTERPDRSRHLGPSRPKGP